MATIKAFSSRQCSVRSARRVTPSVKCSAAKDFNLPLQAGIAVAAGLIAAAPAHAGSVSFGEPLDKAFVTSPVHLSLLVQGMEVRPAADGVIPGTGHFHVNIDAPSTEEGESIPFDDTHKHFGKGQTEVDLELEKGKHKLTLQFANALHQSYGPEYAKTITVNVK